MYNARGHRRRALAVASRRRGRVGILKIRPRCRGIQSRQGSAGPPLAGTGRAWLCKGVAGTATSNGSCGDSSGRNAQQSDSAKVLDTTEVDLAFKSVGVGSCHTMTSCHEFTHGTVEKHGSETVTHFFIILLFDAAPRRQQEGRARTREHRGPEGVWGPPNPTKGSRTTPGTRDFGDSNFL